MKEDVDGYKRFSIEEMVCGIRFDLITLQSALAKLCVKKKPRYVRVNTLIDFESAFRDFSKQHKVEKDDIVSDLLVLPPGTDLHDHASVKNGSIFLQGKASSMVAVALGPQPCWQVLDACSAPGNKTGKITACELNKDRVKRLEDTVKYSGASNVEVLHGNFLNISTEDPLYTKVRAAILLDPSCSCSGTAVDKLDHLLPSFTAAQAVEVADTPRVKNLAAFQSRALAHALSC
ncbi:hypothetical protein MKW94_011510, partial [Papaver nudicaule]|nr:hypothetical protein [Papaver nudicaule]